MNLMTWSSLTTVGVPGSARYDVYRPEDAETVRHSPFLLPLAELIRLLRADSLLHLRSAFQENAQGRLGTNLPPVAR